LKLYYFSGACSLAPHIALKEAGLPFEIEMINLRGDRVTSDGRQYSEVNPKNQVPALAMDDGMILTECSAILQYIADRVPDKRLAPANGTMERYQLQSWLGYINSELHKSFGPLFTPGSSEEAKTGAKQRIESCLKYIAGQLEGRNYLMGDQFTVADCYLFTVLRWTKSVEIDLTPWPPLRVFLDRIGRRDTVRLALKAEGLDN